MGAPPQEGSAIRPAQQLSRLIHWAGPPDPIQFPSFQRYARHVTGRGGVAASVTGPVLLLAWWFTDPLSFPEARPREVLALWRVSHIAMGIVGAIGLTALLRRRRDPVPLLSAQYLFMCATSFWLFGEIGGPCTPWIHNAALMPLPSLVMLLPLGRRLALVSAVTLTTFCAYYLPHPEFLGDPYRWNVVAMLVTSAIFSVLFGHALFELSRRNFEQRWELERLAAEDALTGLANRRRLLRAAEVELQRARRSGQPLSVLMLDMDRFKRINDQLGHDVGDAVLRDFAAVLARQIRATDLAGRLGGEEFAVLLPATSLSDAGEIAERIRGAVAATPVAGQPRWRLSVSVGVASLSADEEGFEHLLKRADQALYEAKSTGRDRVCLSQGAEAAPDQP